jgi:hypothetical protein
MLKPHTWWLFWLPRNFWITISPNIYYPKGIDPKRYPEIIAHETVHLKQQSTGKYKWILKYIFSRQFRLAMEAEAIAKELQYDNLHFNPSVAPQSLASYGEALSSWNYLWAAKSKQAAIDAIQIEINKLT